MSATDRTPAVPDWEDLNAFGRAEERALGFRSAYADHPDFSLPEPEYVLGDFDMYEYDDTMDREPVFDTKEDA